MSVKRRILDLLFPPKCPFCRKLLNNSETGCCVECINALPLTRECDSVKVDFMTKVVAPLYYEKQVRDSFLRYKFHGVTAYSTVYAQFIADVIARDLVGEYDFITWVPLSRKRLRKRGYDQTRLIAEKIAVSLKVPLIPTLEKVRETKVQSTLTTVEERRGNISGSYTVTVSQQLAGKRILLVDDILTTGATLSECARVLLLGGAESVCGAVFARKRGESK